MSYFRNEYVQTIINYRWNVIRYIHLVFFGLFAFTFVLILISSYSISAPEGTPEYYFHWTCNWLCMILVFTIVILLEINEVIKRGRVYI
jgi:uncharacterized protein with PQ loop repeat